MHLINVLTVFMFGCSVVLGAATLNKNQTSAAVDLKNTPRVITGSTVITDRTKYPYQASIQLVDGNYHNCPASLIDNQNLLTSAYCVHNILLDGSITDPNDLFQLMDAEDLQVVLGVLKSDDTGDDMIRVPVKYIFIHEDFVPATYTHDIAVIRMSEEVKFTDLVNKIDLATSTPTTGSECVFSGWGYQTGSTTKFELEEISFTTVAKGSCPLLMEDQFCGSADGAVCTYAFGSPIVCNDVQAGIATFSSCINPITDVAYYREWIEEQQNRSGASGLLSSMSLLGFCIYACLYMFRSV